MPVCSARALLLVDVVEHAHHAHGDDTRAGRLQTHAWIANISEGRLHYDWHTPVSCMHLISDTIVEVVLVTRAPRSAASSTITRAAVEMLGCSEEMLAHRSWIAKIVHGSSVRNRSLEAKRPAVHLPASDEQRRKSGNVSLWQSGRLQIMAMRLAPQALAASVEAHGGTA